MAQMDENPQPRIMSNEMVAHLLSPDIRDRISAVLFDFGQATSNAERSNIGERMAEILEELVPSD